LAKSSSRLSLARRRAHAEQAIILLPEKGYQDNPFRNPRTSTSYRRNVQGAIIRITRNSYGFI